MEKYTLDTWPHAEPVKPKAEVIFVPFVKQKEQKHLCNQKPCSKNNEEVEECKTFLKK